MPEKSIIPRKYRINQWVKTKSGLVGQVIGSAIYGVFMKDGNPVITKYAHVEYRIKVPGKAKTMYRREDELRKAEAPK